MFCSKCGKDCGEFRFCPHCGTQVSQVEEAPALWSVGMACPHCGGVELEGDKCAFCGAVLKEAVPVDEDKEWDSYEIPYGLYAVNLTDRFKTTKDGIIVKKGVLFSKVKKHIPYERIEEAVYTRTESGLNMVFRWKDDTMALSEVQLVFDDAARHEGFFLVFFMIKMQSLAKASFLAKTPSVDKTKMEAFSKKVDLRDLFLRYSPCRVPAAKELAAKCMLPLGEALDFIHNLFDVWQAEVYAQEPRFAARDYNRLIRYRHAEIEKKYAEKNAQQ